MAEFDTQLAEAIARLPASTPAARGQVYTRARAALAAEIAGSTPPLDPAAASARQRELEAAIQRAERTARAVPETPAERERGAWGLLAILILLVVLGAGYAAYAYWDDVKGLLGIEDAVEEVAAEPAAAAVEPVPDPAAAVVATIPSRAILYMGEADGAVPDYPGTISWALVDDAVGPRLVIHVEIPEREMAFDLAMFRADEATGASHTIDVTATHPADFPSGALVGIVQFAGKSAEDGIGNAVLAEFASAGPDHAMISLNAESEGRNMSQMRQEWFDLGLVFADGTEALLTFSKGTVGHEAMRAATNAWD